MNKLKVSPDKKAVILVERAVVLKATVRSPFDGVQLILADSFLLNPILFTHKEN